MRVEAVKDAIEAEHCRKEFIRKGVEGGILAD